MKIVYPTSSFLFSNENTTNDRTWGCLLTLPQTYDVPLIAPDFISCSKCGSCKTPQNNSCPICNPKTFFENMSNLSFLDILITKDRKIKNKPILCLAFDMTAHQSVIQQIIYTVASNDFQKEFIGYNFFFAFLCKQPIFVTKINGIDNLSFGKFPNEDFEFFTSENLSNSIIEAFQIVSTMVLNPSFQNNSIDLLLNELAKVSFDHLFLFYSSQQLPTSCPCKCSIHCIEITQKSYSENVITPFLNGWTHCTISKCTPKIISYLKLRANPFLSKEMKISIKCSSDLEVFWISGSKSDTNVQKNTASIYLTNYPIDYMLTVTFQAVSKYNKQNYFSLQVIYEFSDGHTFIANRAYRKASNFSEWADSINIAPFCIMFLKQKVSNFLKNYLNHHSNKSKWPLSPDKKGLSWKSSFNSVDYPSFTIVKKVLALFQSLFIEGDSFLPEKIKLEVIYLSMTKGFKYLGALFNCLFGLSENSDFICFPPFIIFNQTYISVQPDLADLPSITVVLNENDYQQLLNQITNEIHNIEKG
ncbi:hypothetical protein TRFO_19881 [Tritrichomonas foetus]|uniref:Uncharacterized protein n=1 Tax=Tritrichomonas foetus TaxID=1144522 RepID=A0A1J4KLS1_9EUKA|nr:hypothetical protein TRFO_19881 [Tritrichomonas foetus]|eukprot:OHT10748.1 hypothetical protein TRFO_19881 [Tritrichomonas foetus]